MINLLSRIIMALLLTILLVAVAGFFLAWSQTRREYEQFSERLAEAETELETLRTEREQKEDYLRSFLNDPEVVERVVRERLGYVRPDETVFRYERW